jgi:hypothetical protein
MAEDSTRTKLSYIPPPKSNGIIMSEANNNTINKNNINKNNTKYVINYVNDIVVSQGIQAFMNLWNELGGRQHKQSNTKVFQTSIRSLRRLSTFGTYFNDKPGFLVSNYHHYKFTLDEWYHSLMNFNLAAYDQDYKPHKKTFLQQMSLPDFLYNPYSNAKGPSSQLIHYIEHKPDPKSNFLPQCKYPELLRSLIKVYDKNVLGEIGYQPEGPDERNFILAANRLGDWFVRYRNRIYGGSVYPLPMKQAEYLWRAMTFNLSEERKYSIHPGWFGSDLSINQRLPAFLNKEGVLSKKKTSSRKEHVGMKVN